MGYFCLYCTVGLVMWYALEDDDPDSFIEYLLLWPLMILAVIINSF